MSYNIKQLGDFLKETRTMLMYKQTEVAEAIGISVQSYIKYEKGTREPSVEVLYKLASFFKVSPILFLASSYPLNEEEFKEQNFMFLSIISANLERYKWLLKRYNSKIEETEEAHFTKGYINNDMKTLLKIKSSLYNFSNDSRSLKNDLLKEVDFLNEDIEELINNISRRHYSDS